MPRYFGNGFVPFHEGVNCDGCQKFPIFGIRYHCNNCENFNLCQVCYEEENFGIQNNKHNYNHSMKSILSELLLSALSWNNVPCKGCCSINYPGARYSCQSCQNFHLCERCQAENRFHHTTSYISEHTLEHEMKKIEPTQYNNWYAKSIMNHNQFASGFETLDWIVSDSENKMHYINLAGKIAYFFYGPPSSLPSETSQYGYTETQEKQVADIVAKIFLLNEKAGNGKTIGIKFILVSFRNDKLESMLPILVIRRSSSLSYFMEPGGRTYDSWNNFLDKNKLPKCDICYPVNGCYSLDENNQSDLAFSVSAECHASRKIVKGGDIAATVTSLAATGLAVVGLFTPLAPVAAGALLVSGVGSAAYGAGRAGYHLTDRALHKESINPLNNKESFFSWLSVTGSVFAVGSMGGLFYASRAAMTGSELGLVARSLVNTAVFGSIGINGVGIVSSSISIFQNWYKYDIKPGPLELFQLAASLLFFTKNISEMKTAKTFFEDIQKQHLESIRNSLPEEFQRVKFDENVQGERKGMSVSIAKLNKMMKNSDWRNNFGKTENIVLTRQDRHIATPTYANGKMVIHEEAALLTAQQLHKTRYGGSGINKDSTNTIMAISKHEINRQIDKLPGGSGEIILPGSYYGYDVDIAAGGTVLSSQPIEVKNPRFLVKNGEIVHLFTDEASKTKINSLPSHARVSPNFEGSTLTGFPFTVLQREQNIFEETEEEK